MTVDNKNNGLNEKVNSSLEFMCLIFTYFSLSLTFFTFYVIIRLTLRRA
jgi:hypothetical protein